MEALAPDASRYLFAVAYRMLGSAADAEDVVQEALLRTDGVGDVRSARALLTTVVTRLCIDELRSARRRRVAYVGPWLPEPVFVEGSGPDTGDGPDAAFEHAESLSLGFLVMMETLSAPERAVFVLREVLEHDFAFVASTVGKSEPACRKLLERARAKLAARRAPPVPSAVAEQASARFFGALASGDVEALTALLAEDSRCVTDHGGKARASRRTLVGRVRIARMLFGLARKGAQLGHVAFPAMVNAGPALLASDADGVHTVMAFDWEACADGQVRLRTLYVVRNPDKLAAVRRLPGVAR